MKNQLIIAIVVAAFLLGGSWIIRPVTVGAQSWGITPIAATTAGCQPPLAGSGILCVVGTVWYSSINGAAYTVLVPGVAAGVSSFNGRTGAVVPTAGDYTAAQVSNAVSTTSTYPLSCPTASLSTGASGTLTGSSCSF